MPNQAGRGKSREVFPLSCDAGKDNSDISAFLSGIEPTGEMRRKNDSSTDETQNRSDLSTLSNVKTGKGQANPPNVRIPPDFIPEAQSSQAGVSVRYVPEPDKSWYVLRASYGRENRAYNHIVEDGTFCYIAKRYTRKIVNGKQKKVLETLIPNLLFVYTTEEKAEEYVKRTPTLSFLSYYYDHFKTTRGGGYNPPLTISDKEMENFIIATCSCNEHLKFVNKEQCHFKGGETVKVIDGLFKGVEGRVARVLGQQRVVITLSQVGLVSTAYVPTAFLQVVHNK